MLDVDCQVGRVVFSNSNKYIYQVIKYSRGWQTGGGGRGGVLRD